MPTLEERLAFLEGRVEEHARGADGMREALVHLEERMDRRFEAVDLRFSAFEEKMDRRFVALESALAVRFDAVDTKLGRLTAAVLVAMAAMLALAGGIIARLP